MRVRTTCCPSLLSVSHALSHVISLLFLTDTPLCRCVIYGWRIRGKLGGQPSVDLNGCCMGSIYGISGHDETFWLLFREMSNEFVYATHPRVAVRRFTVVPCHEHERDVITAVSGTFVFFVCRTEAYIHLGYSGLLSGQTHVTALSLSVES